MAAGHLDVNGVWIYGEDDLVSPFSSYMNLGANAQSTKNANLVAKDADLQNQITAHASGTAGSITAAAGVTLTLTSVMRVGALVTVQFSASKPAGYTADPTIGTLAVGYRPAQDLDFAGTSFGTGQPQGFYIEAATGIIGMRSPASGYTLGRGSITYKGA